VTVGAYGKESDGGIFVNSALYQSSETRSLKVPEGTIKISLPQIFVGDEAYPLTVYIMIPYSRRTFDRSEAIFYYRPSRARRVVEWYFGICASKWKILEKAFDKK